MTELQTNLFGMPLAMSMADAKHSAAVLSQAFSHQAGRDTSSFAEDVDALRSWFDPVARGARLRESLNQLEPVEVGGLNLPASVLLDAGEGRYLITPEGRAWLECFRHLPDHQAETAVFRAEQGWPYEQHLLEVYRTWSRHRILDVIAKRTGVGAPMLPVAVAIVLLLLVNRSFDPETAIRRMRDREKNAAIDAVVADVLTAFADELDPKGRGRRRREQFSLWGGYPLTEARRRLSGMLVVDPAGRLYLEREHDVITFLGQDLGRRPGLTAERLGAAFDALVRAYRERLDELTRLGSGFERVGRTDSLREELIRAALDPG